MGLSTLLDTVDAEKNRRGLSARLDEIDAQKAKRLAAPLETPYGGEFLERLNPPQTMTATALPQPVHIDGMRAKPSDLDGLREIAQRPIDTDDSYWNIAKGAGNALRQDFSAMVRNTPAAWRAGQGTDFDEQIGRAMAYGWLSGNNTFDNFEAIRERKKQWQQMHKRPEGTQTWLGNAYVDMVGMLPFMWESTKQGVATGTTMAAGAAAAGALAGSAAMPGVGTAAGGAISAGAAFGAGMTLGSLENSYMTSTGILYNALRDADISPKDAAPLAQWFAIPYAGLEAAQLSKIPGIRQGLEAVGKKTLQKILTDKTIKGKLGRLAVRNGWEWLTNILEEGAQGGIEEGAVQMATGNFDAGKIAERAANEGKEAASPMALLTMGNTLLEGVGTVIPRRRNALEKVGEAVEEERRTQERETGEAVSRALELAGIIRNLEAKAAQDGRGLLRNMTVQSRLNEYEQGVLATAKEEFDTIIKANRDNKRFYEALNSRFQETEQKQNTDTQAEAKPAQEANPIVARLLDIEKERAAILDPLKDSQGIVPSAKIDALDADTQGRLLRLDAEQEDLRKEAQAQDGVWEDFIQRREIERRKRKNANNAQTPVNAPAAPPQGTLFDERTPEQLAAARREEKLARARAELEQERRKRQDIAWEKRQLKEIYGLSEEEVARVDGTRRRQMIEAMADPQRMESVRREIAGMREAQARWIAEADRRQAERAERERAEKAARQERNRKARAQEKEEALARAQAALETQRLIDSIAESEQADRLETIASVPMEHLRDSDLEYAARLGETWAEDELRRRMLADEAQRLSADESANGKVRLSDVVRENKLPTPEAARAAGDPNWSDLQRLYDGVKDNPGLRNKIFTRRYRPLDRIRMAVNERGFNFALVDDLITALEDDMSGQAHARQYGYEGATDASGEFVRFSVPPKNIDAKVAQTLRKMREKISEIRDRGLPHDRESIFKNYDAQTLYPVAKLTPRQFAWYQKHFGVKDPYVWTSLAYAIDHHFNNHPNTELARYLALPDTVQNPDAVKDVSTQLGASQAFVKKYDKYQVATLKPDMNVTQDGKLVLFKNLYRSTKRVPYANKAKIEGLSSVENSDLSIASASKEVAPAADISGLPADKPMKSLTPNDRVDVSENQARPSADRRSDNEKERVDSREDAFPSIARASEEAAASRRQLVSGRQEQPSLADKDSPRARLSQGKSSAESLRLGKAVDTVYRKMYGKAAHKPRLRVFDSVKDAADALGIEIPSNVEGINAGGEVYLILENLPNVKRAVQVLLHETIGHHGLRRLLGEDFELLLGAVKRRYKGTQAWAAVAQEYADADAEYRDNLIAEELLARVSELEELASPGMIGRMVARLRRALQGNGVHEAYADVLDADLLRNAVRASREYAQGRYLVSADGVHAMQNADDNGERFSATPQQARPDVYGQGLLKGVKQSDAFGKDGRPKKEYKQFLTGAGKGSKLVAIKKFLPADGKLANPIIGKNEDDTVRMLADWLKALPNNGIVRAFDGKEIKFLNGEKNNYGKHGFDAIELRVWHAISDKVKGENRRVYNKRRAEMFVNSVNTVQNGQVKTEDSGIEQGYVLRYENGVVHKVVVTPDGKISNTDVFTTQYPLQSRSEDKGRVIKVNPELKRRASAELTALTPFDAATAGLATQHPGANVPAPNAPVSKLTISKAKENSQAINLSGNDASRRDPGMRYSVAKGMDNPYAEAAAEQGRLRAAYRRAVDSKVGRMKTAYLDAFNSLAEMERVLNDGEVFDASESAWKMALSTRNTEQVLFHLLEQGGIQYNRAKGIFEKRAGTKSLQEILRTVDDPKDPQLFDRFERYGLARSALERWARRMFPKIKQFDDTQLRTALDMALEEHRSALSKADETGLFRPGMFERLFGFSPESAKKWLETGQADMRIKQAFGDLQGHFRSMRDFMVETGLVSPEFKATLDDFQNYVPFFREAEDLEAMAAEQMAPINERWPAGRGLSGRSHGVKRFEGSQRKTKPLVQSIMEQAAMVMDAGYKNVSMQRTVALMQQLGLSEQVALESEAGRAKLGEIRRALKTEAGIDLGTLSDKERMLPLEVFIPVTPQSEILKDNVVSVRQNGKLHFYEVNDPALLVAVKNFGAEKLSPLMKILMAPKNLMTELTTADPGFVIRNFIRDTGSSALLLSGNSKRAFLKHLGRTVGGLARTLFKNADESGLANLWAGGAGGGYYYSPKGAHMARHFGSRGGAVRRYGKYASRPITWLWRGYKRAANASEMANRMAVRDRVLAEGGTEAEANFQAMDVLNFGMRGSGVWTGKNNAAKGAAALIQNMVRITPFLNARLQGLYKMWREAGMDAARYAANQEFGKVRQTKAFAQKLSRAILARGLMYSVMGALYAIYAHDSEDDDGEKWYEKLPADARNNYWHFYVGDNTLVRIPKPFEVGYLFATIPEALTMSVLNGGSARDWKDLWQVVKEGALSQLEFDPLGNPILNTAREQIQNRDSFTGRPIVGWAQQGLPANMQYDSSTSATGKAIAHLFGWADAVNIPGLRNLASPARVDNVLNNLMGGLTKYTLSASDAVVESLTGIEGPTSRYANAGFLGADHLMRWATQNTKTMRVKQAEQFYDIRQRARELYAAARLMQMEGREDELDALLREQAPMLSWYEIIEAVNTKLSEIAKKRNNLSKSRMLTRDEMIEQDDLLAAERNRVLAYVDALAMAIEDGRVDKTGYEAVLKRIAKASSEVRESKKAKRLMQNLKLEYDLRRGL